MDEVQSDEIHGGILEPTTPSMNAHKPNTFFGVLSKVQAMFRPELPADCDPVAMRKQVLEISGPAMMELMLMQISSMVSTMMVGNLGNWAIAAVGYCSQPRFLLLAAFIALNSGATALVARAKGSGDYRLANQVMHQTLLLSVLLSIGITALGIFFAEPMVKAMGANTPQTISAATSYMRIQMYTFPMSAMTMAITAVLRGIGKTKPSMYYNVAANIVNVIVNIFLIYGLFGAPRLEVAGAAIALSAGQVVAFLMAGYILLKGSDILQFDWQDLIHADFRVISRINKIGGPAMVEQLMMRGGMLIFSLTVASLGTDIYATHMIAMNLLMISFMNGQAFGISATSLLGQSLGQGRPDIGKAYTSLCRKYGLYVALGIALMFVFLGRPLMMLYTKDQFVMDLGAQMLLVVALLQPFQASQLILSGALRGAGDTKSVAVTTFLGVLIMRPVVSLLLVKLTPLGLLGAWLGIMADQSVRSAYTVYRFKSNKWATIKV